MLHEKMTESLNDQINAELYSSYLYLAMAAYAADIGLPGFATWLKVQAQEELTHAAKFFDYINNQGARVVLKAIEEPPKEFESAIGLMQKTLEHERHVTQRIHDLVALSRKQNDFATEAFLQWFVNEQVEEESTVHDILQKLKLAGPSGNGLFMMDEQLGARTFVPPAPSQA